MALSAGRHIGLRVRFILLSVLILLIVFSTLTFILIRNNVTDMRANLLERSKAYASLATRPMGESFVLYKESGRILIDKQVRELKALNSTISNITVFNLDGEVEYTFDENQIPELPTGYANTFEDKYIYESGLIKTVIAPYFESNRSRRYTIVYSVSSTELSNAMQRETRTIAIVGLLSMGITAAATFIFINRYILRPISDVSEQASNISGGDLDQQIITKRHDEIGSLAQSVNHMAQSLKANIAELKEIDKVKTEFMMITSHNLRTPLTIINGYLDGIQDETDIEYLKKSMQNIGASAQRLNIFAEDVLAISRIELGENSVQREPLVLDAVLLRIANEFELSAQTKNITFVKDIPNFNLTMQLDKPQLRSAVLNLLDNALKFTPEGGRIVFSLTITSKDVRIAVSDTGIGISPEEQGKLFTKFHRGTSTLTYDYDGAGIGLYSSKVMINQLGGTILVESELDKGSTFTIVLPLETQATVPDAPGNDTGLSDQQTHAQNQTV